MIEVLVQVLRPCWSDHHLRLEVFVTQNERKTKTEKSDFLKKIILILPDFLHKIVPRKLSKNNLFELEQNVMKIKYACAKKNFEIHKVFWYVFYANCR